MIWNELEDMRRRENRARGYVEVKTPLIYDKALWEHLGPLGEVPREHVPDPADGDQRFAIKPMNCPGHMRPLRRARCAATASCRCATPRPRRSIATSSAGSLHGLTRVRACHPGRRAHLLHARADRGRDLRLPRLRDATSTTCSTSSRGSSSRPGPRTSSAPTRSGTSPRARSRRRSSGASIEYSSNEGDGAFYGPKIDLHMTDVARPLVADGDDPARQRRCRALRPAATWAPTTPSTRRTSSTARCSARSSASSASSPSTTRAPSRSGSRRCRSRILPVGEGHREAAHALARAARAGYRVDVDDSDETVGKRIRNGELEKIPFTIVYGDRRSDESLAIRERGGGQTEESLGDFLAKLATLDPEKQERTRLLTSRRSRACGGSTESKVR